MKHDDNVLAFPRSLSERIEAARLSKDTLDHPLILPLARMVENELRVVSFAVRAIHLQETSFVQHQEFVLCQMELRNAITTWEGGHHGQVLSHENSTCVVR